MGKSNKNGKQNNNFYSLAYMISLYTFNFFVLLFEAHIFAMSSVELFLFLFLRFFFLPFFLSCNSTIQASGYILVYGLPVWMLIKKKMLFTWNVLWRMTYMSSCEYVCVCLWYASCATSTNDFYFVSLCFMSTHKLYKILFLSCLLHCLLLFFRFILLSSFSNMYTHNHWV